jgi:hypothetical protein
VKREGGGRPVTVGDRLILFSDKAAAMLTCESMLHQRCGAVLCCAVLCCAVLCCAVLCCAVLCCAVLCCAGL